MQWLSYRGVDGFQDGDLRFSFFRLIASSGSGIGALALIVPFVLFPAKGAAQNDSWIEKQTLLSCLSQARDQGIDWKYLAFVENGNAHLLLYRDRGGDVFLCRADQMHAAPNYH